MTKRNLILLTIASLIVLIIIVWLIITKLIIPQEKVTLTITTNPSNAQVYVNNVKYQSPVKLTLKKGIYTIDTVKSGYLSSLNEYTISDNKDHSINITLKPDYVDPNQRGVQ